ncbi:MAG: hypothetical protein JKY60_03855 [Kordiimonadaceae bacterium]|nr:hypothetical protein [Kordiimonadaceae bacterium]
MAKRKKAAPVARKKAPAKKRGSGGKTSGPALLFLLAVVGIGVFNTNVAILLAIGLLPTLVLAFTAKGDFKSNRILCVALANMAGVVALLGDVWSRPDAFASIVSSMSSWVIMWGGASLGYALIFVGPMIAAIVLQGLAQDRVKNINQQRQELIELWGHDVVINEKDGKPKPGRL